MPSIFTYVFWILIAKVTGPETVGIASSIASLVIIIATIDGLDMFLGMKRKLSIAISSRDIYRFKQILVSTLLIVSIVVTISSILIAIPSLRVLEIIGIQREYTWIIIAMIFAQSFQYILMEAIIAALKSKSLVIPFLLGSLARFPILFGIYLLFNTTLTVATIIAFSSLLFITTISFAISLFRFIHQSPRWKPERFLLTVKDILAAGLSSWIPHTANVAGYWLGIIAVFSSEGAASGGKFYISLGIFTITLFVLTGITKVTHALIARIDKKVQQDTLLLHYMKIAFIFSLPFATPLLFFSADFLGLMGQDFRTAGQSLSIFIVSLPLLIISELIYYFVYGLGDHRSVLFLGLVGNVPRIVIYFILSPILGINGAAVSFLIGSAAGLLASIKIRNAYKIPLEFRKYVTLTGIPMVLGALLWVLNMNFLISTIVIIIGSFLAYVRLFLFTTNELHEIVYAIMPSNLAERTYIIIEKMMKKIQ
jgi:O-antigen/teichoic acid export membrane protein